MQNRTKQMIGYCKIKQCDTTGDSISVPREQTILVQNNWTQDKQVHAWINISKIFLFKYFLKWISLQIFVVLNSKENKRSNKYDNKVNMTSVMKDPEGAGIAADEALGWRALARRWACQARVLLSFSHAASIVSFALQTRGPSRDATATIAS